MCLNHPGKVTAADRAERVHEIVTTTAPTTERTPEVEARIADPVKQAVR